VSLHPAVLALNLIAVLVAAALSVGGLFAGRILKRWDLSSASPGQLALERQTYLIATLAGWALAASALSLLLFVYTAEDLSSQLTGAMCATGVLNANVYGWPVLVLKVFIVLGATAWLTLNAVDNASPEYPLVQQKYLLLLGLAPLALLDAILQVRFFAALDPEVITSCCGSLFSADAQGVAATISALPAGWGLLLLGLTAPPLMIAGNRYRRTGTGGGWFALTAVGAFAAALIAIVSTVALFIYEHPHHHCPFCILKAGHGYVGYALYLPLFLAVAAALSAGLISRWAGVPGLTGIIRERGRWLASLSLAGFAIFYGVALIAMLQSNLVMGDLWW
jgi:hypothetical protein